MQAFDLIKKKKEFAIAEKPTVWFPGRQQPDVDFYYLAGCNEITPIRQNMKQKCIKCDVKQCFLLNAKMINCDNP